ncbi:DeoR/GlpR transcriptional regulator [Sporolactobacillus sp. THM7-4]|nr:DeoR/GlpR transcriptional regulator [Sporolactobacillus sp. THM7-4]
MYQEERLVKILAYLNEHQSMSVAEICERFQVSRDTARRDIVKLVGKGAAIRTHGGIALPDLANTILAYRDRLQTFSREKMKIGSEALSFLRQGGHYFLDTSTTVSCMAQQIDQEINVYTHSLDIAEILSHQEKSSVFLFGGALNTVNRYFFDIESVSQLEKIHFDVAFLGAAAITNDGFYYDDKEDAYVKGKVSERSRVTAVLADSKKFIRNSRYKGLNWSDVDLIITNETPPSSYVQRADRDETQLIIAQ